MVEVAGQQFYTSELLFSADYTAYRDIGTQLCTTPEPPKPETKK